jgi:hypothetical protein
MSDPDHPRAEQRRAVIAAKRSGIFDRAKLAEVTGQSLAVVEQVVGRSKDPAASGLLGQAGKARGSTQSGSSSWPEGVRQTRVSRIG